MDMEIVLSVVVLAVMDCPISAHSLSNKISLHIIPRNPSQLSLQVHNSIRWGVTRLTFLQAVVSALSLTVQRHSIKWSGQMPGTVNQKDSPRYF